MPNKLMVLTREQDDYQNKLDSLKLPDLEIYLPKSEEEILEFLPQVNILLANPPIAKKYINRADSLVWMQSSYTGIDAMIAEDLRSDYILTNVREAYGRLMAEYVIAYVLLFEKQVLENLQWQKQKLWKERPIQTPEGKSIGIMGTGSVGREVAKAARTLGMHTLGFRTIAEAVEYFDEIHTLDTMHTFLSKSDYLVSALPSTKRTKRLIRADLLQCMKQSCVFINIGRGDTVCEKDLVRALREQRIKAAVLDVFEQEPLAEQSPFWGLPNVYVTPHISGYLVSDRIFEIFEDNYHRFLAGQDLLYRVDFDRGY